MNAQEGIAELFKGVGEPIKPVGAMDDQRQALGRTFFGTLLGQTIVLIIMILIYIGSIAVIWLYGSVGLKTFHSDVGEWLWLILSAPFICILVFSLLPTLSLARRERRLKAAAMSGDVYFDATNFRPYPYQETDRETFTRLDGADHKTLNWLISTKASSLYFSGPSGVGKSSLLAASVLPQLRDAGWMVIDTRLVGDPIERLRTALLGNEMRNTKKADVKLSLGDLLKTAAEARARKGAPPILLVIDQKYLMLHNDDEPGAFPAFLSDLVTRSIEGLRLLFVFRSDRVSLLFKLDLPLLVVGQNWQELAPYNRDQAIAFLRSRGRDLSAAAFDRLFRGLDRIEHRPGRYRLITLNMVGLVLERKGRTLEGYAGRLWLIQSYLKLSLTTSESRDYAKPLLARLISDAGTKQPRSEAELAKDTGFAPWQVKATLAELARHGLVRRLDAETATWEIAHDFLAGIIGQLISQLKSSVWQRLQPFVAPAFLLGWIALAVVGLTF
jgi:hypothetical protein